ncbi:hypothetical protein ILUMI_06863 [Ignelater luminosus]|uniref:Uncharacterized protein n=1 Tax=Ignelater luminosus TaxID=2038154 RepID=A0A8K0D9U3_IGNLU|nr:hypothetical protein ILUMI_06863 [Ignelater luminosus]
MFLGSYCTDNSQRAGVCQLISECPSAIAALQNKVFPKTCGFQGKQPIVCCVGNDGGDVNPPTQPTPAPIQKPTTNPTPPPTPKPTPTQPTTLRVGDKSKAKCKEYAQHVYVYAASGSQGVADCGIIQRVPKIVGGAPVQLKEFPHMALLGFEDENNKISWKCGGSLISDQFILTATQCLFSSEYGDVKHVRVGDLQIESDQDDAQPQDFTVLEKFIHPDYKKPSGYNDIALLKLNRKAELNNFVRPACLETCSTVNFNYHPIATGWGRTAFLAETSTTLLKVTLEYFTHTECDDAYKSISKRRLSKGIDDTSQVCAGSRNESKDTCQGDSGGPLQIVNKEPYCTYNIVGITSFGKACGFVNVPGVYTRVSNYIEWIEGIVWPE